MIPTHRWHPLNTSFLMGTLVLALVLVPIHMLRSQALGIELAVCAAMFIAIGLSVTAGYHRLFSHRTYHARWPLRLLLLCFGAAAFQNSALQWASESASDQGTAQLARLRLASFQAQQKSYDEALKSLSKPFDPAFAGLASDVQGDIYAAQNKSPEAIKAYSEAWRQLEENSEYRRLVAAKLNALGVDPENAKGVSK